MMPVQLKGPPKGYCDYKGCLAVIGSPPGAAERAYMDRGPPCKGLVGVRILKAGRGKAMGGIPAFSGVVEAREKLRGVVPETPLLTVVAGESRVWCKCDSLQPIGAFKLRGAWHRLTALTEDEKKTMCRIVSAAGADYIKTSTGFSNAGATHDDIKLFKKYVSPSVKIKAAGGIHTLEDAAEFLSEGADRLGTSAIVGIAEKELDEN